MVITLVRENIISKNLHRFNKKIDTSFENQFFKLCINVVIGSCRMNFEYIFSIPILLNSFIKIKSNSHF